MTTNVVCQACAWTGHRAYVAANDFESASRRPDGDGFGRCPKCSSALTAKPRALKGRELACRRDWAVLGGL